MLDKRRIDEAARNVKDYIINNLLRKVDKPDENIISVFKKNSEESMRVAQFLFNQNYSNLWVIVSAYYSMFYMSNAVLYKLGYKVGGITPHKVVSDSLVVFVRDKLKHKLIEGFEDSMEDALELAGTKADELVQSFDQERIRRSRFQYELSEEVKKGKAEVSLMRAKNFVFEMEKFLKLL